MKQIFLIALREYKQYIFSRGFLLFLFLFPIGVFVIGGAVGLAERTKPVRSYLIYDQTGLYADQIETQMQRRFIRTSLAGWDAYIRANVDERTLTQGDIGAPFAPAAITALRAENFERAGGFMAGLEAITPFLQAGAAAFQIPKPTFQLAVIPDDVAAAETIEDVEAALRPYLLGEKSVTSGNSRENTLFAAIILPKAFEDDVSGVAVRYWSRNLTDDTLQSVFSLVLNRVMRKREIQKLGLDSATFEDVSSLSATITAFRPDRTDEEAALGVRDRVETILPGVMTYMLLIIIFGVGNLLLTNTIEERSNKIVEVLLSSVTADQLMLGKLIGIAAVGLTMPTIFLFGGTFVTLFSGSANQTAAAVIDYLLTSPLLFIYLFYFLCAYAIFSMIFLAIGAVSNSLQDAQSYMGPVMMMVFAPLPFMPNVFQNPNGMVATVLTWIPVYTPYAVLLRASSGPPMGEIIGATILMLVFAAFMAWGLGRVFRNAILQSTPTKIGDVWRLARRGEG